MDILLVRPRDPRAGTTFTRFRTLTLPSVAAELLPHARVTVVDESVQPLPSRSFDLVGVTCDTPRSPRAYELADELRAAGQRVMLGGTHPTACPDEALEHCDSVALGEVEGLGARIVEDLAAGALQPRYQLPSRPDLSSLPVPPVDLLPSYSQRFQPYPIELTRGCRNACRFCFNRVIHGPGFRRRALGPLIEELRRRPERFLVCMDDNIMNDPEHLADFAEQVAPLGKVWGGQATLDIANDSGLLGLLRASGFTFTFLGLESFSRRSLKGEAKGFNDVTRYAEQLARLRRHGVLPFVGIMVGLDGDEPEVFERTAEALERIQPAACAFTMPVAFPGTRYFERMAAAGRVLTRDATLYDGHHVVLRPERMSVRELHEGYHRLCRRFTRPRAVLRRLRHYARLRTALPRWQTITSYAAISLGYWRFHERLSREGAPGKGHRGESAAG